MSKTVIGLWLDHKKAIAAIFVNEKPTLKKFESSLERKSKSTGGSRKALPYTFDGGGATKKKAHKRENTIKVFLKDVSKGLPKTDHILVMGPGSAKNEFSKLCAKSRKSLAILNADRLTDRQIAAQTRSFFHLDYEPLIKDRS